MDSSLYNKMLNLKKSLNSQDIVYLGTIEIYDVDSATNKKFKIAKDVFISSSLKGDENIIKFYDEKGEIIAVDTKNSIYPSSKYENILHKGENIDVIFLLREYASKKGISLNSTIKELDDISTELGISKEEILSISKASFESKLKEEKDDSEKIHLKEDDKEPENVKYDPLKNIGSKQKASLSQKIDGIHSLGSILNVPDDGELIVVYSDSIYKNENSTKFSFLIKDSSGNLSKPENLNQIAGIHSSLNIAESNRDGSNITNKQVNSTYLVKSSSNIDYVLTANIGSHGTIDVGFGQIDKTQGINGIDSTAITIPIETSSTYYHTTREVKDDLVTSRAGDYQATRRVDELEEHKDANCEENLTSKEADGDKKTGHLHDKDDVKNLSQDQTTSDIIAQRIYNSDEDISSAFSQKDIKQMVENAIDKHPDYTLEQIEKEVKNDCESYIDSINRFRMH